MEQNFRPLVEEGAFGGEGGLEHPWDVLVEQGGTGAESAAEPTEEATEAQDDIVEEVPHPED